MSTASGAMADLFGGSPLPGLSSMPEIVSSAEKAALIDRIDETGLSPFRFQGWLGKRLTTSYGSGYDFDAGRLAVAQPIPDWLGPVRDRAARFAGLAAGQLTQALLIRYGPGAGIGWHPTVRTTSMSLASRSVPRRQCGSGSA